MYRKNIFSGTCQCSISNGQLGCTKDTYKNFPSDLIYHCLDKFEEDFEFIDLRDQPWPNIFNATSLDKTFIENYFILLPKYVVQQ